MIKTNNNKGSIVRPIHKALIAVALSSVAAPSLAQSMATINVGENPVLLSAANVKMYPYPEKGQTRHIIALTPLEDESEAKVELRFSKMLETDCNKRGWSGTLDKEVVRSWGYDYYTFTPTVEEAWTMMICREPSKVHTVVTKNNELHRYNSRLPIVVYTDADVNLDVRVWKPTN